MHTVNKKIDTDKKTSIGMQVTRRQVDWHTNRTIKEMEADRTKSIKDFV